VSRANEFCDHVGFPKANLLADPSNVAYDALNLKFGVATTFLDPSTPYAILERITTGKTSDLTNALSRWKPWIPPKLDQGLQQGGTFVFDGSVEAFAHYDPSTGAHADLNAVVTAALAAADRKALLR